MSGTQMDQLAALALAGAVGLVLFITFRLSPRASLVAWLLTIAFVPVWFALPVVVLWVPATIVGALVLMAALPWGPLRMGLPDALVAAFFVACVAPIFIGSGSSRTAFFVAVTQWGLAFVLGRVLPNRTGNPTWVHGAVASVMGLVAVLAIPEFLGQWNPFVELEVPGRDFALWGTLQERGGLLRAEGAFGHSIALGCSLALAVPFALATKWRLGARISVVMVLLLGTVVTLSRVGMASALLGILLTVTFAGPVLRRTRNIVAPMAILFTVLITPWVLGVLSASGEESRRSLAYRADLLELIPSFSILGTSPDAYSSPLGGLQFRGFTSIDSALVLLGLTYGWLPLVLALILLGLAVASLISRRTSVEVIAVVAQIPALTSVALITQYSMLFWFVCGLAVAASSGQSRRVVSAERSEQRLSMAPDSTTGAPT